MAFIPEDDIYKLGSSQKIETKLKAREGLIYVLLS